MKNLFLVLTLIVFGVSCNKEPNTQSVKDNCSQYNNELRSCWWCISEDVLGMIEGGVAGGYFGPMGAAVGGAAVGAYRSIKEYNGRPRITQGDSPEYLTNLALVYTEGRTSNEFNNIGLLHNEILHELILNKNELNSTLDYYEFMEKMLLSEFPNFQITEEFRQVVFNAMKSIDNGENIPISSEYQSLYDNLENAFKSQDDARLLLLIDEYEESFEGDQVALQGIATAYHTWYFWKNL